MQFVLYNYLSRAGLLIISKPIGELAASMNPVGFFVYMSEYRFDTELAKLIGVDEAIVTSNLVYWITKNIANRKHFYQGKYWTYNSVRAFTDLFDFWTPKQIRRIMESLYKQEVVLKGNFNKLDFDKTGWYAITDKYNYLLPIWANDVLETANGDAEKGKPIPNKKTNNKPLPQSKDGVLFDYDSFTDFINQVNKELSKSFKETKAVKSSFVARIKSGYTLKDLILSLQNAKKDQFHIDNNFNHLTPEFITRIDKLEKYLNYKPKINKDKIGTRISL